MTIYPEIFFHTATVKVGDNHEHYYTQISSFLRKKHTDGKWYLQYFFNETRSEDYNSIEQCVNDFNRNIYLSQLFGKVIPEAKSLYGYIFQLDEDQRSEEERLNNEIQMQTL